MKDRPLSILESSLTIDTANCIAQYLDRQSLHHLMRASKSTLRLFGQAEQIQKLIHLVYTADYDAVNLLLNLSPNNISLIFKPQRFSIDKDSIQLISPLKMAFKLYDSHMWKLFLNKINQSGDEKEARRESFLQQAHDQSEHIDLLSLFDAHNEYNKLCPSGRMHRFSIDAYYSGPELKQAWRQINLQQRLLPPHMLREFTCEGKNYWSESAFHSDEASRPKTSGHAADAYQFLCKDLAEGKTLMRGKFPRCAGNDQPFSSDRTKVDEVTLSKLLNKRREELHEQIKMMEDSQARAKAKNRM